MEVVIPDLATFTDEMFELTGFDKNDLSLGKYNDFVTGSIAQKYVVPPFSILDTRAALWQNRKKIWLALCIDSGEGRDQDLLGGLRALSQRQNTTYKSGVGVTGTSIFDPVLAEISYKWFAPAGGSIIDPFCGGSVRGIVAAKLGYKYAGTELSATQVEANKSQLPLVADCAAQPNWICDDAKNIAAHVTPDQDMLFTCPPYADLEVYSDDPRDLSNMPYPDFLTAYRDIIKSSCALLKDNRFAVIVVGEVRNKAGSYLGFIHDTVQAFEDAGLHFYNEMILVNMINTLSLRINKQFLSGRKIGKTHQNVLVFWKGDLSAIPETVREWPIDRWEPSEDDQRLDSSLTI